MMNKPRIKEGLIHDPDFVFSDGFICKFHQMRGEGKTIEEAYNNFIDCHVTPTIEWEKLGLLNSLPSKRKMTGVII